MYAATGNHFFRLVKLERFDIVRLPFAADRFEAEQKF